MNKIDGIEPQLAKLLESPQFAGSQRHGALLRYLADHAFDPEPPTESRIAIDVLGRKETAFDARTDSIVRVELNRLRGKIADYYAENPGDPLIVNLPKRSYRLDFRLAAEMMPAPEPAALPTAARPLNRTLILLLAAGCMAVLAYVVWIRMTPVPAREPASPVRLTSDSGLTWQPNVSPDGKLLAYSSDRASSGNMDIWVQQFAGGPPLRITSDPEDESEPAFSPDGAMLAFRSEKEGGGIYVVPSLGGEPRLLAASGRRPRYSPDGKWIAYWTGAYNGLFPYAKTWVVSASGGAPRRVAGDLASARFPVWRADSQALLFLGSSRDTTSLDWYVASISGGASQASGARDRIRKSGLRAPRMNTLGLIPLEWSSNGQVLFPAQKQGENQSTNLWTVTVETAVGKMQGTPTRATAGAGVELDGSTGGGRLVFANVADHPDIWSANPNLPASPASRVTQDLMVEYRPGISADGRILLFDSPRTGAQGIWSKDLATGQEFSVSVGSMQGTDWRNWPVISHDGARAAYQKGAGSARDGDVYVRSTRGEGPEMKVCDKCLAWDWFWDNRRLLVRSNSDGVLSIVNVDAGSKVAIGKLEGSSGELSVSPDDRRILYLEEPGESGTPIAVAALNERFGRPSRVSTEESWHEKPRWSAEGKSIVFVSDRDGHWCIWRQTLNSSEPVAIRHFHATRTRLSNLPSSWLSIALGGDVLVYNANELTGNLWLLPPVRE